MRQGFAAEADVFKVCHFDWKHLSPLSQATHERVSPGISVIVVVALSVLSWAVLIALVMAAGHLL